MISTPIQIRFADIDMAGHVHNAAYLHYFETARIGFFLATIGLDWDWKKQGIILKKNVVEYHFPILLTDTINVEIHVIHIGTKSFTLSYRVVDSSKTLKCYGESVIVCIDYHEGKTITIPDKMLAALQNHLTI